MKVLYINSLYSPHIGGGAEVMLKSLAEGMKSRGHQVTVLTTGPEKRLYKEAVNEITVWRAGIKNVYWQYNTSRSNSLVRLYWHWRDSYNASMCAYIGEVISKEKPDIVNCHNLAGWSIAAWDEIKKNGLPIIQTLHDYYLLCPRSTMFNDGKICNEQCSFCKHLRRNHPSASNKIDAVVGVSNYVIERIYSEGYFRNSKRVIIHNSCDLNDTKDISSHNGEEIIFGYIGTLSESKGVEWLINEFQRRDLPATLKIAGTGQLSYERYLKSLLRTNRIKFMGYVPSKEFFSNIDVCVVPSLWAEPFGMVAIEANAFHVPVITSGKGGQAEIIIHEKNGLIVDANVPDSLGNALYRIIYDKELYSSMQNNARESVLKYLQMDRMLSEYEEVYSDYVK